MPCTKNLLSIDVQCTVPCRCADQAQNSCDWLAPSFIEGSQQIDICSIIFCACPIISVEKVVFYFYTVIKIQKVFSLKLLQKQTPATELYMQLMFFHSFQGKKLGHNANHILS